MAKYLVRVSHRQIDFTSLSPSFQQPWSSSETFAYQMPLTNKNLTKTVSVSIYKAAPGSVLHYENSIVNSRATLGFGSYKTPLCPSLSWPQSNLSLGKALIRTAWSALGRACHNPPTRHCYWVTCLQRLCNHFTAAGGQTRSSISDADQSDSV